MVPFAAMTASSFTVPCERAVMAMDGYDGCGPKINLADSTPPPIRIGPVGTGGGLTGCGAIVRDGKAVASTGPRPRLKLPADGPDHAAGSASPDGTSTRLTS